MVNMKLFFTVKAELENNSSQRSINFWVFSVIALDLILFCFEFISYFYQV